MKIIAKLSLITAITALAAMAFASSASATTVCSNSGTGPACAAGHGNQFTGTFHATSGKAVLTITNGSGTSTRTFECESTIHGHITNSNGTGNITSLSFTNCKDPSGRCTNITVSTPRTGGPAFPWAITVTSSGSTRG